MLESRLTGGIGRERPVGDRPRRIASAVGTSLESPGCAGDCAIGAGLCLGVDLLGSESAPSVLWIL